MTLSQSCPKLRAHDASFDRILGIVVPRRGGVAGCYEVVHESLVFLGEIVVQRSGIVLPMFLSPGSDNRRRDDLVF
jgi:hypothetical protein